MCCTSLTRPPRRSRRDSRKSRPVASSNRFHQWPHRSSLVPPEPENVCATVTSKRFERLQPPPPAFQHAPPWPAVPPDSPPSPPVAPRRPQSPAVTRSRPRRNNVTEPPPPAAFPKLNLPNSSDNSTKSFLALAPIRSGCSAMMQQQAECRKLVMEQQMQNPTPTQKPTPSPQQQGQSSPSSQQTAGTTPKPKPQIRDWASI